jgi:hypothetical protein
MKRSGYLHALAASSPENENLLSDGHEVKWASFGYRGEKKLYLIM